MAQKRTKLTKLNLSELSLVDRPANGSARVVLTKRQDEDGDGWLSRVKKAFGFDVTKGDLTPGDVHVPRPLGDDDEDDDADYEELDYEKNLGADMAPADLGDTSVAAGEDEPLAKHHTPNQESTVDEETLELVLKGLPPEAQEIIKAQHDKEVALTKRLEALEEQNAQNVRLSVAKRMVGDAPVKAETLASVLKGLDDEGATFVGTLLKQYNALLDDSGVLVEKGSSGTEQDTDDVGDELAKSVTELRKAFPKLSEAQLITKAYELDPALYDAQQ